MKLEAKRLRHFSLVYIEFMAFIFYTFTTVLADLPSFAGVLEWMMSLLYPPCAWAAVALKSWGHLGRRPWAWVLGDQAGSSAALHTSPQSLVQVLVQATLA